MNACNEATSAAGFSNDTTRYELHSHDQQAQWEEGFVHGPNHHNQSQSHDSTGAAYSGHKPIPAGILARNATTMLAIMDLSAYPDSMTPTDMDLVSRQNDTLGRLGNTATQLQGYADAWGSPPMDHSRDSTKYKLQALGVEYGTTFQFALNAQQVLLTKMTFELVERFPASLGLLWYQAWYCYRDWEGGDAALCQRVSGAHGDPQGTGKTSSNTLKTHRGSDRNIKATLEGGKNHLPVVSIWDGAG